MGAIPLTEQSVINQVTNYANKLSYRDMNNLSGRGENGKAKKLVYFNKKADIIINQATTQVRSQFKNNSQPSIAHTEQIIELSSQKLYDLKDLTYSQYSASITTYAKNMAVEFASAVDAYTDNLISQMGNPSVPTIANIKAAALNAVTNLVNRLLASAASIIDAFLFKLVQVLNQKLAQIAGLIDSFNNFLDSADAAIDNALAAVDKYSKMAFDFYKRLKGVSSTSEYIQANVPDVKGKIKANLAVLATTPDAKIIIPKLKFDINLVKYFLKNPLARFFPTFVPSLIPLVKFKNIIESPPTSMLNKYGETEVIANKSGFTQIRTSTPGNVTTTVLHPSGSNDRVLNDGSKINKTVGDITQITDGNWDITTTKDKVEIVAGEHRFEIRKNYIQNIVGDANINIFGDKNTAVFSDVVDDFKSNYSQKVMMNSTETCGGNRGVTTGANLTELVGGNHKETVVGGLTIHVTGAVNIISGGVTTISAGAACNVQAAGLVKITGAKVLIG